VALKKSDLSLLLVLLFFVIVKVIIIIISDTGGELEMVLQVAQSSVQDFRLVTENTHLTQHHAYQHNF